MRSTYKAALALAAGSALILTGCTSPGSDSGSEEEATTLKVAWTTIYEASATAIAEAFEAENPGVTIDLTIADSDAYATTLRTQLVSGTGPDVFWVDAGSADPESMGEFAKAGYIADLSDEPWVKELPEGLTSRYTQYDGGQYYVPQGFTAQGVIYNMDLLAELGVQPATTFDELLELCSVAQDAGKTLFTWPMGRTSGVWLLYQLVGSSGLFDRNDAFWEQREAKEVNFADTEEWQLAMDDLTQLYERGCLGTPGTSSAIENDDVFRAMGTGAVLGVPWGNPQLAGLRASAPDIEFELYPLPATNDAEEMRTPMEAAGGPAINASISGATRELADKYVAFIASEAGQILHAENDAAIPGTPGLAADADAQSASQVLQDYIARGRTAEIFHGVLPNPEVKQEFMEILQAFELGQIDGAETLRRLDASFDSGLD